MSRPNFILNQLDFLQKIALQSKYSKQNSNCRVYD